MSQQPATNPVVEFYKKWSDRTPYVTRTIVVSLVVEWVVSFFLPLEIYLGNVPRYTVLHFEIYRLLVSPMVGNSILMLVLAIMSFQTFGTRWEGAIGSASFLSLMATISLMTNVIFTVLCYFLYLVGTTSAMYWECMGFWTILFALITIECLQVKCAHHLGL